MQDPKETDTENRALEQELKQWFQEDSLPSIPDAIHQKILKNGRLHSHRVQALQKKRQKLRIALSIAAMLMVGISASLLWFRHSDPTSSNDQNQPYDIVDAYQLSLRIKLGQTSNLKDDYNQDGQVDHLDVETLCRHLVQIQPLTPEVPL